MLDSSGSDHTILILSVIPFVIKTVVETFCIVGLAFEWTS